jgi:hypothetical protein
MRAVPCKIDGGAIKTELSDAASYLAAAIYRAASNMLKRFPSPFLVFLTVKLIYMHGVDKFLGATSDVSYAHLGNQADA